MPAKPRLQPHPEYADKRVLAVLKPAELLRLEQLKQLLKRVFPLAEIVCPKDLVHLQNMLHRCQATHPLVVAMGGDGTLHQVLQGLDLERQALALLPLGTGNDFARCIGYPALLRDKVSRLSELRVTATDFGIMSGCRYLNSAGFGIDSATLALRENNPKSKLFQNYNYAFVCVLSKLQPVAAKLEIDGKQMAGTYYWVLVMNNSFIGGGTRIAPQAVVDDGLLDVLLVSAESKLELLLNLPRAISGKHLGMKQVTCIQARHVLVRSEQPVRYLAADGELHFHGSAEVEFQASSGLLRMLR